MLCQQNVQDHQTVPVSEVPAYLSKGYCLFGQVVVSRDKFYQTVVWIDGLMVSPQQLPSELLKAISLNKAELKCLKLLLSDHKMEESGQVLGRVPSVARKIIAELRSKFYCRTTYGLVQKICSLGFDTPQKIDKLIQDANK